MNYNLKNKTLSLIALLFAITVSANSVSFAADAPSPLAQPVAETSDSAATKNAAEDVAATASDAQKAAQEEAKAAEDAQKNIANLKAQEDAVEKNIKELDTEIAAVRQELETLNADLANAAEGGDLSQSIEEDLAFLEDNKPNELDELGVPQMKPDFPTNPNAQQPNGEQQAPDAQANPNNDPFTDTQPDALSANQPEGENAAEGGSAEGDIPAPEAPKSPFESFGNAILSKVDNTLFNKMSTIEKQTTLLRLEAKREELKNRVLTLRMQRLRAMEEAVERKRQYEEKLKNAEAERQAKILEEQRKLKEREMELEKLRQAKVINDYMNEMLMMNQKWVEENAKLHNRIHELEEERVELINVFKKKMDRLGKVIKKTYKHVVLAVREHFVTINNYRNKISELEKIIADRDAQIRALKESAENPFGAANADGTPSQADIDLSQEYAIMDITGQGDDIVAKLVNAEGKTFSVHQGSVLKNGEVVTAITDTYISFENRGVKSYLYTGGSVREYEPQTSFHGASEDFFAPQPTPTEKVQSQSADGKSDNASAKDAKSSASEAKKSETSSSSESKPAVRYRSGSRSMFSK